MSEYVRLRANPEKVRVSLRRRGQGWIAYVEVLADGRLTVAESFTAAMAVEQALAEADDNGFDGIDLGCDWAYRHPQNPRSATAKDA